MWPRAPTIQALADVNRAGREFSQSGPKKEEAEEADEEAVLEDHWSHLLMDAAEETEDAAAKSRELITALLTAL